MILGIHWNRLALAAALSTALAGAPMLALARDASLKPASPESVGFSSERLKALNATMHGFVDRGEVPGVVTYVARHGKVVAYDLYGKSDLATGAPLKEDTIFRMYSQTKPVTGVAMMILYEQGKWRLDDPVTKYVPGFKSLKVYKGVGRDGKPILEPIARSATMRELMTHTAGFAYGLVTDNPVDKAYRDSSLLGSRNLQGMVDTAAGLPLANEPGAQWRYSIAVDVQGYIVEKLSGQSLPDFMKANIFDPLGMKDTGFYIPEAKRDRQAALYYLKDGKPVPAEGFMVLDITKQPTAANGGGGLVSTVGDFARFAQMLLNGGELDGVRILSPSTIKLMASNHLSDKVLAQQPLGPGVGFGLDVAVVMDPAAAGETGGKGTYSWGGAAGTWFWVDPENDVIVLGMIQVLSASSLQLNDLSRALVYQALVDPEK